jgi:hypothetical protein
MLFLDREALVDWLPQQMSAPLREIAVADVEGDFIGVTVLQTDGAQVRSGLDMYPADVDLAALAAVLLSEIVCGYAMLAMRRPMKIGAPR